MLDETFGLGLVCKQFHDYYLDMSNRPFPKTQSGMIAYYLDEHLKSGYRFILLDFEDIFDLLHFQELDAGIVRCYVL